jgi:enoyl-CoA hydratase/carnithine racemase
MSADLMRESRERRADAAVLYDLTEAGRVAIITLNRPQCLNAYNVAMRDALYEAVLAVRDDPAVLAVVVRGNGRAFCTGGDLSEFGSAPSAARAREVRWLRDVWGMLWRLPAITIAAVHGYAVGGGFELAMLCDQCIASRDARFALPETGLGMIPGVGGTQTLPRLLGVTHALQIVLTGDGLDARAAQRLGLIARVVAPERLIGTAVAMARRVARLDRALVAQLKRAVNDGLDRSINQGLALERRASTMAARAENGDARESVR